jgi:hypothetical protein
MATTIHTDKVMVKLNPDEYNRLTNEVADAFVGIADFEEYSLGVLVGGALKLTAFLLGAFVIEYAAIAEMPIDVTEEIAKAQRTLAHQTILSMSRAATNHSVQ